MPTQTDSRRTRQHQWSVPEIADILDAGISAAEAALCDEQAVHGLDARNELEIHAVLEGIIQRSSLGVAREVRYPSDDKKRKKTEGRRCDLVLTPDGQPLVDPLQTETLFASPHAVELEDAFWLEVKCVTQFTPEGPNSSYASELLSSVRQDISKLAADQSILHAGLLIMLFVASEEVAIHDLEIWQEKCLQKSMPIAAPATRVIPISDRLGNAICYLSIYPVRHL